MEEIRILLGESVFAFYTAIPLRFGSPLEQFQTTEQKTDYEIRIRHAHPGEPTPHRDGYAGIYRDGCRFELVLSRKWPPEPSVWQMMSMLPLSELLQEQGTLTFHASYILHDGEAILFSGPSGIGKSTQAALWQQFRNARIINGDRVLLTPKEDHILVHSHYLSGTSGICENVTTRLRGLVLLEKASHNRAYPPAPLEAFRRIMSQTDYNPHSRKQMIQTTLLVEKLLRQATVCRFDCTMDEGAVINLEKYLYEEFRNPNNP